MRSFADLKGAGAGTVTFWRNGREQSCRVPAPPLGVVIVEAVPLNGYLVAVTPEIAATLAKFSEIQFIDIYQPFLKGAMVDRISDADQDVLVELAQAPGIAETIAAATAILGNVEEKKNRSGLYLHGRLKPGNVSKLLSDPLVLGIHQVTGLTPSDERQAMSLSSNIVTSGGNLVPTQPGSYATWLTGANGCTVCGNLSNEGFIIGIADTGVDSGPNGPRHVDLQPAAPSRVRYGGVFLTPREQGNCPPNPPPP